MIQELLQLMNFGGFVVWVLVAFSVVAVTISMIKLWQFWLLRALRRATTDQALRHLEREERAQALMLVKGQRNPRARVMAQTLMLIEDGRLAVAELEKEVMRLARQAIAELGQYLRPLEVIANLAPLLGLFGTVLGMIEAFQAMEATGSQVNPAVLSGGIWKALLTTAVGLAVAIPVSLLHSWFERQVELQAAAMQNDLEHLFTLHATKQYRNSQFTVKER